MEFQMQALQQSEWEKRVALEKENTVLEEKVATMERLQNTGRHNVHVIRTILKPPAHYKTVQTV